MMERGTGMAQKLIPVVVYPSAKTVVTCGHRWHDGDGEPARRCFRRLQRWAASSDDPRAFVTFAHGPVSGVR